MKRLLLLIISTFITLSAFCANNNKKEKVVYNNGFFKIDHLTMVGMTMGWGPSFKCDGGARDFGLELFNLTASLNKSTNGRYTEQGPEGLALNPTKFNYTFGLDVPLFNYNRFQMSLNPMIGWEVDYYYPNAQYTKNVYAYRKNNRFKGGAAVNFDILFTEITNARVAFKYLNNTLDFSIGITIHKSLKK